MRFGDGDVGFSRVVRWCWALETPASWQNNVVMRTQVLSQEDLMSLQETSEEIRILLEIADDKTFDMVVHDRLCELEATRLALESSLSLSRSIARSPASWLLWFSGGLVD